MENLDEILRLKKEKNAVILAHIYQIPEIQDMADYVGDSLGLSRKAAEVSCDTIVFCGVRFMAETAAILNPGKTVLVPEEKALCPMAAMITPEKLANLKDEYPNAPVVSYVNSTVETKAMSDVCVTSANALDIVEQLEEDSLIFVPDKYLGLFVSGRTDKNVILWQGYCPTHVKISPLQIQELKSEHPDAEVMVHPECVPEVQDLADHILSTGQMCDTAADSPADEFIIGTETGILHTLKKAAPGKTFYPVSTQTICPNMKKITPEKVLSSLKNGSFRVEVEPETAEKARRPIERMLEMS